MKQCIDLRKSITQVSGIQLSIQLSNICAKTFMYGDVYIYVHIESMFRQFSPSCFYLVTYEDTYAAYSLQPNLRVTNFLYMTTHVQDNLCHVQWQRVVIYRNLQFGDWVYISSYIQVKVLNIVYGIKFSTYHRVGLGDCQSGHGQGSSRTGHKSREQIASHRHIVADAIHATFIRKAPV